MNSGSGDNVNVPKTWDLEPICSSSGHSECSSDLMSLEEDKEIASKAVLLVINSARKGAVCLCSNIAELLRDNQRLQKTVEAQRRLIKLLKKTPPALRSHVSPSSQTAPSSSSSSSIVFSTTEDLWSSSSGSAQGERRSPGSITLPPLAGEQRLVDSLARSSPLSKPLEKPTHPAAVASISEVASASVRCPSRSQSQQRRRDCQTAEQEGLRMCQMGAPRPPSTDENVSGQNLKLEEGPSGAEDFTTEEAAEEVGLGSEAEQAGVEASGRAEAPLKDIGGQYAERKKPFLKLGERVVLGRGRKGVVRFIGQLESINSKEIYVGVELDIPFLQTASSCWLHSQRS
ncbi:CAP-Gly domain-containing linker protein 1-like isoform X2 [Polypterus senegalus]|uniref:CAP-Gly domain-containing linker protein 1-like isoform X2 n=1 Tax=Polypterus senegalus TaxID=55291 RepID=UPI001964ACC9|nr:CAP-Gly domain-containing linker protein 1-like isoform X2 [Polypterus senegalus]